MAQVGGGACSAPLAATLSAGSSRCQLWRPAQEVLQFLTECALPPPLLQFDSTDDSSRPNLPLASAVAPVSTKRPPPARWEPPAQMKIMRAAVSTSPSSELAADASAVCGGGLNEKAVGNCVMQTGRLVAQDLSPKPSVGSNSPCSKSDSFVQAASSDCSQQASRPATTVDVWQFPRPSKIPTCTSEQPFQQLPPHLRAAGHTKWDAGTVNSRKDSCNAFARVACSESSSWAPQAVGFLSAERVQSPVSIKASGIEACAARNNSFEAFASRRQDEVFMNKEAQNLMDSCKGKNAVKSMLTSAHGNVSTPFLGVPRTNIVSAQVEGSMPIQSEGRNAVSENDEAAALDLLVNAVRAASGTSSVAGKTSTDYEKEAEIKNALGDNSSMVQKLSYFVHGCVPFKQKRITRRAKSAYQKRPVFHGDISDIVIINPISDAIPEYQENHIRTPLKQRADSFQGQEISKSTHFPEKKEKQTPQQHRSLEAILFGYDSPIVQSRCAQIETLPSPYHDVMISSAIKKSRSRNLRRSSDIWRFHN